MAQKTAETGSRVPVTLTYVTKPTEAQLAGIRAFAQRRCPEGTLDLTLVEDASLGSGFRLTVGDEEFDWSTQGRLKQLREKLETAYIPNNDNLISILKTELEQFDLTAEYTEVGSVKTVGDGIATISGIDHAAYGEIILFDTGTKGMVQEIRRDEIGAILFGNDLDIHEGSRMARTGKNAGVPVGRGYLGRVVNALGAPIDGGGDIQSDGYYPVESPAPGIVERQSVNRPLETGILAIDSMFPIGRGQRELIIGDRQTGKTSLALDTILNQKDKNVICIYVAIGQKSSAIARIVDILRRHDALSYSIVVAATASDSAPLQYIAPYAGTAIGEYFMHSGQDVLMVYDDLSKHAVAYRTLSLLLERSPGREAYPGDVFYLHSRLLERSAQMSKENGGGSLTALPIIETQAGDVSAYIPTNVISITDGQIFLESDLFFSGQRPAVNAGLSVSRVGGAAQTKAMKTATGSIRIDLAQYREMEIFTQFSSDLDDTTKRQLVYGEGLMELLKQPLYHPLTMADQVITLVAALSQAFLEVPLKDIKGMQTQMLDWFRAQHGEIQRELDRSREMSPTLRQQIAALAKEFIQSQLGAQV
ncbi:MAG: F0F1 ATP synthase subunit alpha [Clostridiales bacterium]|nr:F0F1 ATP synthase subunit alpha [Clostridiales bacterium]